MSDVCKFSYLKHDCYRYMSKQGTDLDLLRQFQIYEAVLHHEDGEETVSYTHLDVYKRQVLTLCKFQS